RDLVGYLKGRYHHPPDRGVDERQDEAHTPGPRKPPESGQGRSRHFAQARTGSGWRCPRRRWSGTAGSNRGAHDSSRTKRRTVAIHTPNRRTASRGSVQVSTKGALPKWNRRASKP